MMIEFVLSLRLSVGVRDGASLDVRAVHRAEVGAGKRPQDLPARLVPGLDNET